MKISPNQYQKPYREGPSNLSSYRDECVLEVYGDQLDMTKAYRFTVSYQLKRDPANNRRGIVGVPAIRAMAPDVPAEFLACFRRELDKKKSYLETVQFDLPEVLSVDLTMCFGKCFQ